MTDYKKNQLNQLDVPALQVIENQIKRELANVTTAHASKIARRAISKRYKRQLKNIGKFKQLVRDKKLKVLGI